VDTTQHIQLVPLASLSEWPGNYRRGAVDAIATSLSRFGFNGAMRVRGGTVYAGNHVLKALRELKTQEEKPPSGVIERDGDWQVPIINIDHLSEEEATAFAIADNRTSELGSNDNEILSKLLADLRISDLMAFTAYNDDDLAEMLRASPLVEQEVVDAEPLAPEEITDLRVQRGDIWECGEHRIMCGDSASPEDVALLMAGEKAQLFATDPPYFVDYDGDNRPGEGKDWSHLYNEISSKEAPAFLRQVFENAIAHTDANAGWYVWHAETRRGIIEKLWEELGVLFHQCVIWVKPVPVITYCMYHYQHEPCMHGWRRGNKPRMADANADRPKSVWFVDHDGRKTVSGNEHPTQKPLELFMIPMRTHTLPGDIVLELFSGSGSQLMAAENLQRKCRAMELQPVFVDVALRRWEAATGKEAVLAHRRAD